MDAIVIWKDRHGDRHLAIGCCWWLKKWTQGDGGSGQKLAAACGWLTRCAIPACCKGRSHKGRMSSKRSQTQQKMQKRHKGPRPETAATPDKQENSQLQKWQRGPQTDHRAGDCEAHRRVFCQDSKNGGQDLVEEPATTQVKEQTAHSLRAQGVGAPATLRNFVAPPGKAEMVVCLRLLGTSSVLHSHYLAMAVSLLDSQF